MTLRASTAVGEEAQAVTRAVFGLSLGVGGMAAGAAALIGDPLVIVGIPSLAWRALSLGARSHLPAMRRAAVWVAFLPRVSAEALSRREVARDDDGEGGWIEEA